MANVLAGLKKSSASSPPKDDASRDLRRAVERADDARDIARDMLRRLPAYSANEDEITARHDAPDVHVHVHQHSEPDHDSSPQIEIGPLKARNLPKWLVVTLAAIVAAGTALLARLSSR